MEPEKPAVQKLEQLPKNIPDRTFGDSSLNLILGDSVL